MFGNPQPALRATVPSCITHVALVKIAKSALNYNTHPGPIVRYNNAILAIDIKSVSLNVKVQSALGLVLCNFSWYIFPGGPFKSTTEKKEKKQ
jgi:hypothetical protein